MAEMVEVIKQFLDESEFRYDYNEELKCYDFGLSMENGAVQVRLVARQEDAYFMVYAVWEGHLPVRSLPLVLPIINEINYHTKFTTMAIDPKDGELSCHCGLNTDDSELTVKQVGVSLQVTVKCLDDNVQKIMRIAWSAPANSDGKLN